MSTQALLIYQITPTPPISLTQLQAAVEAISLSTGDMANFGATLVSDTTTIEVNLIQRTIIFDISSAQFQANFPGVDCRNSSPPRRCSRSA